ncbi:MAG: PRC-barrel domain-containing protein [bacterium]|nr:PRC-barrel domain-containing protein [bacterium]
MHLRDDELIGLRVESTSGRRVGKLVGFVLDCESGIVVQYRVRPAGLLTSLVPGIRELLIGRSQVVSIDAHRMLVQDSATSDVGRGQRKRPVPSMSPQPLSSESK